MILDTEFECEFYHSAILGATACVLLVGEFSYTGFGSDWARAVRQAMKCVEVYSR